MGAVLTFQLPACAVQQARLPAVKLRNYLIGGACSTHEWLKFLFTLSIGLKSTITAFSFYSVVVLSLMTGILVSLLVYKTEIITSDRPKGGLFASAGLFLGVLAPGCASCGIGLAAVLGLGAFLVVLPYGGAEISAIAIAIIGFSIYKTSKGFYSCKICRVNLGDKNE